MYTIKQTDEFTLWLNDIKDKATHLRLLKRLDKVARGLLGDVAAVGEGVWEMREFFGSGWRMYYIQRGDVLVVMLGGGDKSTQEADIEAAKLLSSEIKMKEV